MKLSAAKDKLLRRQAHLLQRFTGSKKDLTHDKEEYHAISVVLLELKKLEAKVDEYENPSQNGYNEWNITD